MNLQYLFEIQAGLDAHIEEEHPELQGQNNLDWKILALQVELGECANEWRGFKKWSKDQEPRILRRIDCNKCMGTGFGKGWLKNCSGCGGSGKIKLNPLLEEYVDCLHFILSIGLELDRKNEVLPYAYINSPNASVDEIIGQFNLVFRNTWNVDGDYYFLINNFIELGSMLGFTWEQIETAYLAKNKINHERQVNGY